MHQINCRLNWWNIIASSFILKTSMAKGMGSTRNMNNDVGVVSFVRSVFV
jgi:hypothetical protein